VFNQSRPAEAISLFLTLTQIWASAHPNGFSDPRGERSPPGVGRKLTSTPSGKHVTFVTTPFRRWRRLHCLTGNANSLPVDRCSRKSTGRITSLRIETKKLFGRMGRPSGVSVRYISTPRLSMNEFHTASCSRTLLLNCTLLIFFVKCLLELK